MKLLYVLHDFLPEHVGGSEVHTFELASELSRRGHEVAILCTERDLTRRDGELRERRHGDLRVLEVAHAREYDCAEQTWEEPRSRTVFELVLGRERPDLVHVQHFAQWGSGVLEVARDQGVPTIVTLHDFHLLCANACLMRADGTLCGGDCAQCLHGLPPSRAGDTPQATESAAHARRAQHRLQLELAQAVIAPSRFMAEFMSERAMVRRDRLARIDSGVVGPWREPRASDARRPLQIGYVGGIYPTKGVHVLVEAFAKMRPGLATLDLHGVLDWFPSYVGHLRTLAGERTDLRWHGRFAPEDIDAILETIDVLVVPSLWYENRPLTIQSAFRCGVCVVASDLGGMAELVLSGRGGELFPRGDAAALSLLLSSLALDRGRVLALARARPRLPSIGDVALQHLELYARAIAGKRPSQ